MVSIIVDCVHCNWHEALRPASHIRIVRSGNSGPVVLAVLPDQVGHGWDDGSVDVGGSNVDLRSEDNALRYGCFHLLRVILGWQESIIINISLTEHLSQVQVLLHSGRTQLSPASSSERPRVFLIWVSGEGFCGRTVPVAPKLETGHFWGSCSFELNPRPTVCTKISSFVPSLYVFASPTTARSATTDIKWTIFYPKSWNRN